MLGYWPHVFVPPPRQQRHRYLRRTSPEGDATAQLAPADPAIATKGNLIRQLSLYSWAKLIARV